MKTIKGLKFISQEEHMKKMFKKPGFKEAYDALEPEFKIIEALIDERIKNKLTQRQLAKKIGITQSALARFESRRINPSFSFMQKLAKGLELVLTVKPARG